MRRIGLAPLSEVIADIDLSIRLSELTKTVVAFDGGGQPQHLIVRLTGDELFEGKVEMGAVPRLRDGRECLPRVQDRE